LGDLQICGFGDLVICGLNDFTSFIFLLVDFYSPDFNRGYYQSSAKGGLSKS
jgi:hypothetical protein